ncbi:hypothetical protein DJ568_02515 [Mucilaginibacter hurinus]|uniref:Heparan-alpha-glucosaminide N-acetyltransferase catalytic domain-containing protein n=1 Tax=Mucilaginibacter hurinus TaxID=2201324 RepID=A0A367GTK7_9SPHI|nr:heparan-alpha-glucosaminide N-acetyltransferase domain-containing protein [Mucilaginibacter hurinus]RCH56747.1 hypothetical protein DJ568_02515 [Mucilaginibacter hurinus]
MTSFTVQPKQRVASIDILRGIIMVIMALDHTRDFFMPQQFDPTDLTKASTGLFLTRFITHFCAPIFVFLAGTGAYLSFSRGKTKSEAARFLVTRGLWLIVLELTIVTIGWSLRLDFNLVFVQVMWALGISMIVLAALIYLPVKAIAAFGLAMILGHNAFDGVEFSHVNTTADTLWRFLHVPGIVNIGDNLNVYVLYPLIPWIGVMALGYSFGVLFTKAPFARQKILIRIGGLAILLFIIIRSLNLYGDPQPWSKQEVWYRTVLSFINVQKYPPSLDYLLITLGVANLALAGLENSKTRIAKILIVFGQVPLFYYILHLYVLKLMSVIAYIIFKPAEAPGLPYTYLAWAIGIIVLYFPCRWYRNYKMTHKQWWLSYL